ncbi:MAG: hypothetical protein LRZ92_04615 [Methanosarcinaceae archaeon]|jgi:hypothetical protein|nr:hypothetical protein [Methanosarcinaceae archaeon]NKQ38436.1 hypothetical protein [Methanosarcinales archaeon]
MTNIKDAPKTATTIVIRSDAKYRISRSRDPYYALMRRLFQEDETASRGQKFLLMIEDRQKQSNPVRVSEWNEILEVLGIGKSSFYLMRNKLLSAGLISNKNKEYRLSNQFSKDLEDMANWWSVAVIDETPSN